MVQKERPLSIEELIAARSPAQLAELITRAAGAGVWSCDLATGIFWGDPFAAGLMGQVTNGGYAVPWTKLLRVIYPRDRSEAIVWWRSISRSTEVNELHFRVRTWHHRIAYLGVRAQVVQNEVGKSAFVVGLVWDETYTRRREREHQAIVTISETLRQFGTEEKIVQHAFDEIRQVLDTPHALIAIQEEGGDLRVRVKHACGKWAVLVDQDSTYDEGIIGSVLRTRQPYCSASVAKDPRCLRPEMVKGLSGFMAIPLVSKDETFGVLALGREECYDDSDLEIAKVLAGVLATALARMRHEHSLKRRMRELSILHDIHMTISNTLDLSFVLAEALTQILGHLGADAAAVYLLDKHTNTMQCKAARGFRSCHIWHIRIPLGKWLPGVVALEQAPVLILGREELHKRCQRHNMIDEEGFVAYAGFPLKVRGQLVGVLELFRRNALFFAREWVNFAECVAGQVAVAVANADLYTNLERMHGELLAAYEATIEGWARAQELRDVYTERHSLRVTELFLDLARHVGYEGESLVVMRRGALLHDIGKIGIPDTILRKPGPLTEEEWKVMREHPRFALEMLRPIKFLEPSLDIPAYHHERWDGRGYPFQLKGEEIPHSARLFAVVDVYDALTSERPYRAAWSCEEARNYIVAQAGSQFDPDAVQAFLDLLGQTGEVASE
ncbi:MAG: GAF domain-containing protein [Candidatus Sumerlaeaceae bacterium]|nr:GAF domain-containing protein [Candidatus Sumerlaeaceae bacterium]